MNWQDKQKLEEKLRKFTVNTSKVQQVRILVVGPVGAGKSSFINSVNSVFQGRITIETLADTTAGKSFTKTYRSHYIEGNDGKPLAFIFNDIMGLEADSRCGVQEDDIISAVQGFIQERYKFNPDSPLTTNDQPNRSNPDPIDQVFCLVYVLPADKVSLMDRRIFDKIKYIREKISEMNMPQVIIMTKPDEACPLVRKDLKKIYTSKKIKEKMQECSNLVGVPMTHNFPVKNYHEEMDTENDIDVLILKALDHIVTSANDFLKKGHSGNSEWCE